jgi:chloramphenicol O-acetyltransferase type A
MRKEINIDDWERKEHFTFFLQSDLPFYNVNFNVEVPGVREACKVRKLSVNNVIMHVTIKALSRISNFLYRLENGKVVKYDRIDPSFACIRGNEELFRMVTVDFHDDMAKFDESVKMAVANSVGYFDFRILKERTNLVFISALPWIPFAGVDHTLSLRKEDTIPRISWGKIHKEGHGDILPYNIQVNHIFIDGIHVGMFYEYLKEEIKLFACAPDTGCEA